MDRVRFEAINPTFLLAVTKTPRPATDRRPSTRDRSGAILAVGRLDADPDGILRVGRSDRRIGTRGRGRAWPRRRHRAGPDRRRRPSRRRRDRLRRDAGPAGPQGYKVGIVDLTDGEPTPLSPGPDVRLAEARARGRDPRRRSPGQPEPAQPPALRHVRGAGRAGQGVPAAPAQGRARLRRQDRAGLARPLPGDADHRRGRLLQPADEVGRALRRPAGPHGRQPARLPDRAARSGLARGVGLHRGRHRPTLATKLEAVALLRDPVPADQGGDLRARSRR